MRRRAPAGPSLFDDEPELPPRVEADLAQAGCLPGCTCDRHPQALSTADRCDAVAGAVAAADLPKAAALYAMSPQEQAAAVVPIPDRSRWAWPGKGTVEVRGTTPLMVWFSLPDAPALAQQTVYRHDFLRRAVRQ